MPSESNPSYPASARIAATARLTASLRALVIDTGILGEPGCEADITRAQVAEAAGYELAEVQAAGSRGAAVERMQDGLRKLLADLHERGEVDGALCLGGAEGALIGAAAMQALPIGVPKVIVSPSASGPQRGGCTSG